MPVYDFAKKCENTKAWFFAHPRISKKNKDYVRKYIESCEALKRDMHNAQKINKIFST
jgi:hypothetical protein